MNYFFMLLDYLIPILMIVSYPWWIKKANGPISHYSGMRTTLSMKNQENWKKAHLLCGKYCLRLGLILVIFVFVIRHMKIFSMEWTALLVVGIAILSLIVITGIVNNKLK